MFQFTAWFSRPTWGPGGVERCSQSAVPLRPFVGSFGALPGRGGAAARLAGERGQVWRFLNREDPKIIQEWWGDSWEIQFIGPIYQKWWVDQVEPSKDKGSIVVDEGWGCFSKILPTLETVENCWYCWWWVHSWTIAGCFCDRNLHVSYWFTTIYLFTPRIILKWRSGYIRIM